MYLPDDEMEFIEMLKTPKGNSFMKILWKLILAVGIILLVLILIR